MGGVTAGELAAVRGRLERFADDIFASLPRKDQRARGACYLRGLMLNGRRRSVEPMAQRLGEVHYQALHHLVAASPWTGGRSGVDSPRSWSPRFRRRYGRWVTPASQGWRPFGGVQRQYCATLGKTANCQLGVSVNAVTEQASCPLDWRLLLPERWDADAERRAACHVPSGCGTGPSGSWRWTCSTSSTSGIFAAGAGL